MGRDLLEGREFEVTSPCPEVWTLLSSCHLSSCFSQIQAEAEPGAQAQREILSLPQRHKSQAILGVRQPTDIFSLPST